MQKIWKNVKAYYQRLKNQSKADEHRKLHNENQLFYTLHPQLLMGITKAFQIQKARQLQGDVSNHLLDGGYYEFGLFKGFGFWFAEQISKDITSKGFQFYGFDSFEGLPVSIVDADQINWQPGNYAASLDFVINKLKENGTDFTRVHIYKGFFSKELFSDLEEKENFLPVSICVIDSDMYESCVEVLNFIKKYLVPGSILLFDDFNAFNKDDNHGERRALKEFEIANPKFVKKHLFDFGHYGVAFIVESI
jgi:hypothetical protein